MDIRERLLDRIDTYQARVDDTASEFRRRLAALEAPENREVAINLGARAKLVRGLAMAFAITCARLEISSTSTTTSIPKPPA
jgi:hypothetical protein